MLDHWDRFIDSARRFQSTNHAARFSGLTQVWLISVLAACSFCFTRVLGLIDPILGAFSRSGTKRIVQKTAVSQWLSRKFHRIASEAENATAEKKQVFYFLALQR